MSSGRLVSRIDNLVCTVDEGYSGSRSIVTGSTLALTRNPLTNTSPSTVAWRTFTPPSWRRLISLITLLTCVGPFKGTAIVSVAHDR